MSITRLRARRRAAAIVPSLAALAVSCAAWAAPPLTLDEALRLAESNSPAARAATQGVRAAQAAAIVAGEAPDPVLRVGVDNLPVEGPDRYSVARDGMTMRRIGLMQEHVSAEKRALQRQRGELEASREEAARLTVLAGVRREVAAAWLDRYYAERSRQEVAALEGEIALQLRTLDAQVRAAKAGAAEVAMARAALVQTRDRALALEKDARVAEIALARWLGEDARRAPRDPPPLDVLPATPQAEHTPAVEEHAREREMAATELALAEANRRPNWSWEVTYAQRGNQYDNMISFGLSIPLTLNRANRQDQEVAARRAQLDKAHAQHEEMAREAAATLAATRAEWENLVARRRALEETLIPAAKERVALTLAAYRAGQASLAATLEARRAAVDARLQVLDLERQAARLWAALRYGYTVSEGLSR